MCCFLLPNFVLSINSCNLCHLHMLVLIMGLWFVNNNVLMESTLKSYEPNGRSLPRELTSSIGFWATGLLSNCMLCDFPSRCFLMLVIDGTSILEWISHKDDSVHLSSAHIPLKYSHTKDRFSLKHPKFLTQQRQNITINT